MRPKWQVFLLTVVGVSVFAAIPTYATPLAVIDPFFYLINVCDNSLGETVGARLFSGASSVMPDALGGTAGTITYTDVNGLNPVTRSLFFDPSSVLPHQFDRSQPDSPSFGGPATLTFMNSVNTVNTASFNVPSLVGFQQAPFVNTVTISGSASNPTF